MIPTLPNVILGLIEEYALYTEVKREEVVHGSKVFNVGTSDAIKYIYLTQCEKDVRCAVCEKYFLKWRMLGCDNKLHKLQTALTCPLTSNTKIEHIHI